MWTRPGGIRPRRGRRPAHCSTEPSGHAICDTDTFALGHARRCLESTGDGPAADLAKASNEDFLRRLDVVVGNDTRTNAGGLHFLDVVSFYMSFYEFLDTVNSIGRKVPSVPTSPLPAGRVIGVPERP